MKKIKHISEAAIVKVLFFIFRLLPIDIASEVGGFIATAIGPYLRVTGIARKNLKMAFPEKTIPDIEQIIKGMWKNLGQVAGEFPHIYRLSSQELAHRVQVEGLDNLAILKETGGIFFSAHIANWELSPKVIVDQGIKMSLVYRSANNKLVDEMICQERNSEAIGIIAKGSKSARKIIEVMKKRGVLAMLVDQKLNDGIKIPFFGMDAMTAPAIARLAQNFACPIIPVQVIRRHGANFTIKFQCPIYVTSGTDQAIEQAMITINQLMEAWIRENPSQWFWLHRRWGV